MELCAVKDRLVRRLSCAVGRVTTYHITRFLSLHSNVIGNVYPAYASYLAVREADPEEHKQWLMYWCVGQLAAWLGAGAGVPVTRAETPGTPRDGARCAGS